MDKNVKVFSPNGEKQLIPESQLKDAISSGYKVATPQQIIDSGEPVKVYDPENKKVLIPKDQLEDAIQEGYREATPARMKAVDKVSQMGALGVGASKFINQLAMDVPETIDEASGNEEGIALADEMKRQYPTSATLGSVAGFGTSLLTPFGPAGLLARTGAGLGEKAIAKMAVTEGTKGLAKKILLSAGGKGLIKGAAEGAMMATPTAATQAYFGDTSSAAETLFVQGMGMGGFLGGTIGHVGNVVKKASKAEGIIGKMANKIEKYAKDQALSAGNLYKKDLKKVARLSGKRDFGQILLDENIVTAGDTIGSIGEKLTEAVDVVGNELDVTRMSMDRIVESNPEKYSKFFPNTEEIKNIVKSSLPELVSSPGVNASEINYINKLLNDLEIMLPPGMTPEMVEASKYTMSPVKATAGFSDVTNLMKVLRKNAKFDASRPPGVSREADKIYLKVRDYVDDLVEKLGESADLPELAEKYKYAKDKYTVFKTMNEGVQDRLIGNKALKNISLTDWVLLAGRSGAGDASSAGAGFMIGGIPGALLSVAAKKTAEAYGSGITAGVANNTAKFLRKNALMVEANEASKKLGSHIAKTRELLDGKESVIRPVSVKAGLDWLKSSKDEEKDFNRNFEKVNDLYQNIDKVTGDLSKETEALNDFDIPELPAQYTAHTANAIAYAHNAIPKKPIENPMFKSRPWKPTKTEVREFNAKIAAIDNPFIIYDQFHNGFIDRSSLDAVKNVYPAIFGHIQKEFYDQLSERPRDFSYQTKLMLSNLLGISADNSIDPTSIQYYQQVINKQSTQIAQAKQNSQVKMKNNLTSPVASLSESKV